MGGKVRASHEVRASIEVEDLTGQPTRPADVDACPGNLLRRAGASQRHEVQVVPLDPGDVPDGDREGAITRPGAMALTSRSVAGQPDPPLQTHLTINCRTF